MASVVKEPNDRFRIEFTPLNDKLKRHKIRLGKVSERYAGIVAGHVENILNRKWGNPLNSKTAKFLADLPEKLFAKFAKVGLAEPRVQNSASVVRLGEQLVAYVAKRNDLKPASRLVLGHVVRNLKDYFGDDRALASITAGDADDFARWLATGARKRGKADKSVRGLSPATIGKRLQFCSTIFRDAVRRKIIAENPFSGLKQPKGSNPERQVYVPVETIEQVIENTPDDEWKLLLTLARYLGLRIPSEAFSLTWDCIDWERNRIRVPSPKTEIHGKPFRIVPILPEVRQYLDRLYFADDAPDRAVHVLARLRSRDSAKAAERGFWANMNLRQHLLRLLERAGVKPWPRLFHNLRASAQTDLAARFPIHVVCEWLGNTTAIAQEHYLQVTDDDFAAAAMPSEKAARKTARQAHESTRIEAHDCPTNEETPCFQGVSINRMEGNRLEAETTLNHSRNDSPAQNERCWNLPGKKKDPTRRLTEMAGNVIADVSAQRQQTKKVRGVMSGSAKLRNRDHA